MYIDAGVAVSVYRRNDRKLRKKKLTSIQALCVVDKHYHVIFSSSMLVNEKHMVIVICKQNTKPGIK